MWWKDSFLRRQLYAVLYKNYVLTFRNKRDAFREFGSPIFLVTILLLISRLGQLTSQSIPDTFYSTKYTATITELTINKTVLMAPCVTTNDRVSQYAESLQRLLNNSQYTNINDVPGQLSCFSTEKDLLAYYSANHTQIYGGIIFDSPINYPITYRIRMNSAIYTGGYTTNIYNSPSNDILSYAGTWIPYLSPFLSAVDYAISQTILDDSYPTVNTTIPFYQLAFRQFPSLARILNPGASSITIIIPLYFTLLFTLQVRVLLTRILEEKEKRTKSALQMAGLREDVFWLSWLITALVKNTIVIGVVVLIVSLGGMFPHTNTGVVFILFFLFEITCIGFACAITSLFSKSRTGGAVGMLLYLALSGPSYALTSVNITSSVKYGLSFIAPCGFSLATSLLTKAEQNGKGYNWSNIMDSTFNDSNVSLGSLFVILALDGILYMVLAWYMNQVIPSEFGITLHPFFCCGFRRKIMNNQDILRLKGNNRHSHAAKSLNLSSRIREGLSTIIPWSSRTSSPASFPVEEWRQSSTTERTALVTIPSPVLSLTEQSAASVLWGKESGISPPSSTHESRLNSSPHGSSASDVEPVPPTIQTRPGVQIQNLSKLFPRQGKEPERLAVDNLSLNIYEGQVTCLLGHNGAGKTTTVHICTGLYEPTCGDVVMYGKSVINDMHAIRQMIGVCPQFDVLFDLLTVKEHLLLFGGVKGMSVEETEIQSTKLIHDLGLVEKMFALAHTLSGGQKRRLSVAIALMGNPKVVFLDEPSSGMDPAGRRQVWNVIQQYKHDRVIILTTHFMDEADVLGDRIALMARGSLRVCGSPLFLKNRFGLGYHLRITTLPRINPLVETRTTNNKNDNSNVIHTSAKDTKLNSLSDSPTAQQLLHFIQQYIPPATLHNATWSTAQTAGTTSTTDSSDQELLSLELTFLLPKDQVKFFPALFTTLENIPSTTTNVSVQSMIASYSISMPTMEEVFLRLAALVEEEEQAEKDALVELELEKDQLLSHPHPPTTSILPTTNESSSTRVINPAPKIETEALWWLDVKRRLFGHSYSKLQKGNQSFYANQNANMTEKEYLRQRLRDAGRKHESSLYRFVRQLKAQLVRRYLELTRNPRQLFLQCVTPVIFTGISIVFQLLKTLDDTSSTSAVPFTPASLTSGLTTDYSNYSLPTAIFASAPAPVNPYINTIKSVYFPSTSPPILPGLFNGPIQPGTGGQADTILLRNTSYALGGTLVSSPTLSEADYLMTILYNASLTISPPVLVSLWDSTILRAALNNVTVSLSSLSSTVIPSSPLFAPSFDPFPTLPGSDSNGIALLGEFLASELMGLYTALGFCTIPALQAATVVTERKSRSKQLQYIMGATPLTYWLSMWLWDILQYFVPWIGGMLIMFLAGPSVLGGSNAVGPALLLLLMGISIPLPTYVLSFAFSKATDAQVWIRVGYTLLTTVFFVVSLGLDLTTSVTGNEINSESGILQTLTSVSTTIQYIGMLFPPYALAKGISDIGLKGTCGAFTNSNQPCTPPNVLDWNIAGAKIIFMLFSVPVWFVILLRVELFLTPSTKTTDKVTPSTSGVQTIISPLSTVISSSTVSVPLMNEDASSLNGDGGISISANLQIMEDDDVQTERNRINTSMDPTQQGIGAIHLRKEFKHGHNKRGAPPKIAVADLCLASPTDEIFGLLGPNGAGKTTSISMLVGEIGPTSGSAYIVGVNIAKARRDALDRIGYCPQGDALFELLTGEETLNFYGALAGVPNEDLPSLVDNALSCLGLQPYRSTRTAHYSGGNKRRLSLALAYIGAPLVVFLDEPSTGVDPFARRRMFDVIMAGRQGRTTVLTTHVMEEADALCNRIGIMVDGRLACLGSSQHLKQKYGRGYVIEIVYSETNHQTAEEVSSSVIAQSILGFLAQSCANIVLRETNGNHLRYESSTVNLALIFQQLESTGKQEYKIIDYSISQTTLEGVFLRFSQLQEQADAARAAALASLLGTNQR